MTTPCWPHHLSLQGRLSTRSRAIGSITELQAPNYTGHGTIGWHIDTTALFDFDENWRAGAQIQRTSDINYLPTLGHQHAGAVSDRAALSREFHLFSNYFSVEAYSFQTSDLDDSGCGQCGTPFQKDPVVFPLVSYSYVGDTDSIGRLYDHRHPCRRRSAA